MGEKVRRQIARWTRPAILDTVIGSVGMNARHQHHHRVDDLGGRHPQHRHPGARLRADARRRGPLHRIATIFGIGSDHKRTGIYNRDVARPCPGAGQGRGRERRADAAS
jgi:hypothetical protein